MPIPVAARSNTSVCGLSPAAIAGSNPARGGVEYGCVSVVNIVCCRINVSGTGQPLFQRVLPSVMCLSVIWKPQHWGDLGPSYAAAPQVKQSKPKQNKNVICVYILCRYCTYVDRLCGLVVRVSGYRCRGLGFDSRCYQIFWVVVGLERGPLSLVRSIEELLE